MKIYNEYEKIINLIVLFIVLVIITLSIKIYFQPFFIILIMLLFTTPSYKILVKFKMNNKVAAVISIILINFLLGFTIFYFGNNLIGIFHKLYIGNIETVNIFLNNIKVLLNFDLNKGIETLSKIISTPMIAEGASITGSSFIGYFIGNVATYFILVDKDKVLDLLSNVFSKKIIESIYIKKKNLKEVFLIEVLIVIVSTVIIVIGFKILGVKNSLFLGIICGMLDILPYVGTIIVFIPIIIYNIIMKRYLIVIGFVALYLLVLINKQILEAKFLSSKLDIHPLVVMLSIYIGVNIFGVIGIIAGPIYSIIAKDIIYTNKKQSIQGNKALSKKNNNKN
ncbi:AI-2E family transporter [Clostridium gasigenes]|uniref:Predicted PurR-regulated permease PerM n=1 Tax=Clostridium gasigenes TaxID=94869 RepID=A0A1H0R7X4_9CLOT|nr:AI-2E family transporter [Clostridium gasigenes]MBU3087738.1 AI-2E family transporter [Clostridium gasigenes]SDP25581.1 Predicted PurR-regulated permease PerM [Clostridium gasigenes]